MKSLFFKMGLILTLLVGWIVYDRWDDWTQQTEAAVATVTEKVKTSLPSEPPAPVKTTVYKWQDAQGRWHFSNQAPKTAAPVTKQTYNPNENVLPRLTEKDIALLTKNDKKPTTEATGLFGQYANAVNSAKNIQDAAAQHNEQMDRALKSNSTD